MNEAVTITPFYYFMMEFAKLVYACAPVIIIFAGVGSIIGSLHTEPWGVSWYPPGTFLGIILMVLGVLLGVSQ